MQTPDANGFVNVIWPSRTIAHGGIFHTRVVQPSSEQQQFLKVLLEESKLDIAQRKKTGYRLRQEDEPPPEPVSPVYRIPRVRPRTSHRRSLSAIRESGIFDVDPYKPLKRGEDREKLKERLANFMAYGDSPEQQQLHPLPPRKLKPPPKLPTNKDRWNDLLTQIRERAEWLAEMEELGQAAPHREVINEQIAERLRALDALGVDSECSSARTEKSGFSTLRSREPAASGRSKGSNGGAAGKRVHSQRSTASEDKQKSTRSSARSHTRQESRKEENVSAYRELPKLQYSPRRHV